MACANFRKSLAARAVLFTLVFLTWAGCRPWPMFHHDLNHSGQSQFDTSADTGVQKWKFATKGSLADPAGGADGTIYFGSQDGYLYAVNPEASLKWKFAAGCRSPRRR